jgi:hypothetical protein
MPAKVFEKPSSRPLAVGSQNSHSRECFIFGATSETDAVSAMLTDTTTFPETFTGTFPGGGTATFVRDSASVDPVPDGRAEPTIWQGTVRYALVGMSGEPRVAGDNSHSFDLGIQQIKRKQSLLTVAGYKPGGVATIGTDIPDFHGLIGVNPEEGEVEGVDVNAPYYAWSETFYFAPELVDSAYISGLYVIASHPVSLYSFRGFAAYEVLFLGAQGTQQKKGGNWEITYKFAANPNVTDFQIGEVTGITKRGWDYCWGRYKSKQITAGSSKFMILAATAAYVEKVYEAADFAGLGIGTASLFA